MKRFTVCIMVFLLMLWFSGNSVHAKTPNRLQITNSEVEMDDPVNPIFHIYGLNFGDAPRVSLGDDQLIVDPLNSSNDYIEATLAGGILPGTYRLSVARKGFDFSHPEKADSLDVTISAGESSDTLNQINIYEITQTFRPTRDDSSIITGKCQCDDENDIAINGGFNIIDDTDSNPELTIMESKIHRETENEKDFYRVLVKNHSYVPGGPIIRIEANVICINVP